MRWFHCESPAAKGWIKLLTKEFRQKQGMAGTVPEASCLWQWTRGKHGFCCSMWFKTTVRCFLSTYSILDTPYALSCLPSAPTSTCVLVVRCIIPVTISCAGLPLGSYSSQVLIRLYSMRISRAEQGFYITTAHLANCFGLLASLYVSPSMVKKSLHFCFMCDDSPFYTVGYTY